MRLRYRIKYKIEDYLYKRKKKPYSDSYNFWMVLHDECEKVIFTEDILNNAKQLKRIECIFDEMSKHYLKRFTSNELYDIWCDMDVKYENFKETFEEFSGYLRYASDRMGTNRWLYCRINITNAFVQINKTYITEELEDIWYGISEQIKEECKLWFKNDFLKLYEDRVKNIR